MHPRVCALLLVLVALPAAERPLAAQYAGAAVAGGPRFFVAGTGEGRPVRTDPSRVSVLRARISLDLANVTLETALGAISAQSGMRIAYSRAFVPLGTRVSLSANDISIAAALTEVLLDTGVDVLISRTGQITLTPGEPDPAQQEPGAIVGRVTDAETGAPIVGAQILVDGRGRVVTDADGRYRIDGVAPGRRTVSVTHIGYARVAEEADVGDGATVTVDFTLEVSPTSLNELVVTVTGEQRVREVGNVVARIQADSLTNLAPVMSFGDLIQGRAPGVFSMTSSNKVGQAGAIRIRGLSSIGVPNDPIVVVDGIRVETTAGTWARPATEDVSVGSTGTILGAAPGGFTGRLSDFDPDEIASVEVVKGPSAATLYGTDAANGVLVITTKRGRPGRARWTVFTEQGLVQQRLEDWGAAWGGTPYYAFGRNTATDAPQRCTLLERAANSCVLDSLVAFNLFTDPETRPFKDGHRQQYGLQVSGGTAGGATYFLSGDYEQETGTFYMPPADQALIQRTQGRQAPDWQVRPNAYKRVNLRANLTTPLGRRGNVTLATGFVSNQARQGEPGISQLGYRDLNDGWLSADSRPAYIFAERREDVVRRFLGSVAATYTVKDWLTLRGTVGTDLSTNAYGQLLRRGEGFPPAANTGFRNANELSVTRYSLDVGATASHALSETLSSKTSIGVQYNRRGHRGTNIQVSDLPLGGETLAGGTVSSPPGEATFTTAVAGGYVEEVLGIHDRLFLTGALRFDGGSAFGRDFSVAAYPKASLSWVVIDGQAGPYLPGVSSLRLRAAYGASGVQPGPIDALQRLFIFSGVSGSGTSAAPGAVLSQLGNADLKPERTSELEAGLDLELWQNRLRLELTAYQSTSEDALLNRELASSVGGGRRWENLGSVRNRGLELVLNADLVRGGWLSASLTLTGALNENRLLSLGEGIVVSNPATQYIRQQVGYPLYGWWGRTVQSYADANGNGILELSEVTITPGNHFIGPDFPTREATAAPAVGLFGERLRLSGLLQYRGGFYAPSFTSSNACTFDLACRAVNDASTPLADQARAVARLLGAGASGVYNEPNSYLLLRELSASVTMPPAWGRVVGARDARLVLAARNVAMLWRQGTATTSAFEAGSTHSDYGSAGIAGPSTYWLLRLHLNY